MAAMAFRFPSAARKLGSWSNSITFHLHRITRQREALPSTAPTILSNNINQLQPRPASYLDHENILPRRFTSLISDVGRCDRHYEKHALFAVKEFNKQKDAQLQFVRWVRESQQLFCGCMNYFITLEAADAGTVKLYQAIVAQTISKELRLFGLVLDSGRLLKLIDNRRTSPKIDRTRDPIDTRELYYDKVCRRNANMYVRSACLPVQPTGAIIARPPSRAVVLFCEEQSQDVIQSEGTGEQH